MKLFLTLLLIPAAAFASPLTRLSPDETKEVDARLRNFYADPTNPAPMNVRAPKYDLNKHAFVHPNEFLRGPAASNASPLIELAGKKATPAFERAYCEKILKNNFPKLYLADCVPGMNASVEANDRLDDLVSGWIPRDKTVFHLDYIPQTGQTALPVWADDYWRTRWGGTSFRYSAYDEKKEFKSYKEAVASYAQPTEWNGAQALPPAELAKRLVLWSPAEKYDASVGDVSFSLTNEEKRLGTHALKPDGDVEDWMGLCHGWAAASLMVPPPMRPTDVVGANGATVTWYPEDVRAMVTQHWANGQIPSNYIGGRCNSKKVEQYANGRLVAQECFDTNPATFHLALGNLIGREKLGFVMDKSFDYEVWNQPVVAYEFTYFNPLDPTKKSKNWKEVSVDYDSTFRGKDRFQQPLTRGVRNQGGYDDSEIKKVVGVIANVVYVVETTPPTHGPTPDKRPLERAVYTYDLELHEVKGHLYPMGGEWHENAHPDFLWMPKKDSAPVSSFDDAKVDYTGAAPTAQLTDHAGRASAAGFPLCAVVKELVKRTSGVDGYKCP